MKKICFRCKEEKALINFHRHSGMKDGFLNKCSACVANDVSIWRTKNPDARKKEYIKRKPKLGITRTQQEYFIELRKNGKGRKVSIHEYCSKRRMRVSNILMTEFDDFVQKEASDLCGMREKLTNVKWHIDHIVPLNHKEACGLHNGYNLQVVPASWNIKKGNRNMNIYLGY